MFTSSHFSWPFFLPLFASVTRFWGSDPLHWGSTFDRNTVSGQSFVPWALAFSVSSLRAFAFLLLQAVVLGTENTLNMNVVYSFLFM